MSAMSGTSAPLTSWSTRRRRAVATTALTAAALLLTGCAGEPAAPELTTQEREAQFWDAWESRLGMPGRDYADPAAARSSSIDLGYAICDELAAGIDRDVL